MPGFIRLQSGVFGEHSAALCISQGPGFRGNTLAAQAILRISKTTRSLDLIGDAIKRTSIPLRSQLQTVTAAV